MKVPGAALLSIAVALSLTGCASIGPPQAPSLELPKPPSDLRAVRKGDAVTLTWTVPSKTTDRQSLRYLGITRICRSPESEASRKDCGPLVGEVPALQEFQREQAAGKKISSSFKDTLALPAAGKDAPKFASYAVEVLNAAGRGAGISNRARVPLVATLSPFLDFTAGTTAEGVVISWRCPGNIRERPPDVRYFFRIYRRLEASSAETRIADVDATGCALGGKQDSHNPGQTSFTDQNSEWEKSYQYRGNVVTVIGSLENPIAEVEGLDTPEVKVFVHDTFPPATPEGLQAVFSEAGGAPLIDLIWNPVADADLAGYNIYRRESDTQSRKLNSAVAKSPAFRDAEVVRGKKYFYSVSAVDERANESPRSNEAEETLP